MQFNDGIYFFLFAVSTLSSSLSALLFQIFQKVCEMWRGIAQAAGPFLREQRSPGHFEFFGIDVIADDAGDCWLIEINRVPGLESSDNRCKPQEDAMFDEMMLSTLHMVLAPLFVDREDEDGGGEQERIDVTRTTTKREEEGASSVFNMESSSSSSSSDAPSSARQCPAVGWWRRVSQADPAARTSSPAVFNNIFNWKAFTSKNKSKLFV